MTDSIAQGAIISTVNYSEVIARLLDLDFTEAAARQSAMEPELIQVAFSEFHALLCGSLRPLTRHLGLSLGDRACLALGRSLGLPVLTADRVWAQLDVGVEVVVCR